MATNKNNKKVYLSVSSEEFEELEKVLNSVPNANRHGFARWAMSLGLSQIRGMNPGTAQDRLAQFTFLPSKDKFAA